MTDDMVYSGSRSLHRTKNVRNSSNEKLGISKYGKIFSDRGSHPAKVKTIKKFLGANYEVAASNGHVRDFPKSQFGIDVEHDYEPKYITIRGKGDILANLRKEVKKAEKIYLATDPDRDGRGDFLASDGSAQALR